MALRKTYLYKISRDGTFLGVLQNVTSPFGYSQIINNAGSQMVIKVSQSAVNHRDSVDYLMTEDGDFLITEDGDFLTTERTDPLVGNDSSNSLIRNNNDVEVYEFSANYPNGKLVFTGYISKWKTSFGNNNDIQATILSYGTELDNTLIQGATTLDVSQATGTDEAFIYNDFLYDTGGKGAGGWNKVGQNWIAGGSVTNLVSLVAKMRAATTTPVDVTCKIYDNASFTGTPLGTAQLTVSGTSAAEYTFGFANLNLTAGGTYYFALEAIGTSSDGVYVLYKSATNPYASGTMYNSNYGGGSGGGSWYPVPAGPYAAGSDLYFKTYYTAAAIDVPFSSFDPSDIISTILDNFHNQGGVIDLGSADATATTTSYTFKLNTVLEGIKKCLELAPSDWYWYVDLGTNLLYFKETATAADHVLVLGHHISSLDVEANIEGVKNLVYFSGGDTGGGQNLFMTETDSDSQANFRIGLARISDNRVTSPTTGTAIMDNFLSTNADEVYNTTVEVFESTYDINLFKPGQIVGFGGFGNFVDTLLLQIVGINRAPDSVQLKLGVLPRRATKTIEDILRALNDLQTVDNPSSPS